MPKNFILFIIKMRSRVKSIGTEVYMSRRIFAVLAIAMLFAGLLSAQESAPATTPTATLTAEAQLCTGIDSRMPTGMADKFPPEVGKVFLWCRILGATDTTMVKHIWFYNGQEMATVNLPVKSSSYRTWSSKTILPEWTGNWSVKIVDADGATLKEMTFTVGAAQ